MTVSSVPYCVSSLWIRLSAAVPPVCSVAWMLASIHSAGFSWCGPVAVFVIVASVMARSSCERPISLSDNEVRMLGRQRIQELGELPVTDKSIAGNVNHDVATYEIQRRYAGKT